MSLLRWFCTSFRLPFALVPEPGQRVGDRRAGGFVERVLPSGTRLRVVDRLAVSVASDCGDIGSAFAFADAAAACCCILRSPSRAASRPVSCESQEMRRLEE